MAPGHGTRLHSLLRMTKPSCMWEVQSSCVPPAKGWWDDVPGQMRRWHHGGSWSAERCYPEQAHSVHLAVTGLSRHSSTHTHTQHWLGLGFSMWESHSTQRVVGWMVRSFTFKQRWESGPGHPGWWWFRRQASSNSGSRHFLLNWAHFFVAWKQQHLAFCPRATWIPS